MWAGNIPNQGESFSQQWTMSTSTPYANMPHEQVDWATLAQQWIKMKEEAPAMDKEGGEAPMEIAKDEPGPSHWLEPPPHQEGTAAMGWGWKMDKNGEWVWTAPKVPSTAASPTVTRFNPAIPAFQTGLTAPDPPIISPDPTFPYAVPAERSSYWSGAPSKRSHWEHKKKHDSVENLPELDAAKRKILPAWIREGLEKMEKEKLKKAEYDKQERIRTEEIDDINTRNQLPNGNFELPKKSKFDSDSEDSGPDYAKEEPHREKKRSRFDWSESQPSKPVIHRTKEQILEACMLDVRKVLTRLLMEVTTEEIQKAVDDSNKKYRRKGIHIKLMTSAPATPIRKTPALTSLTGKLGLGIYDSGSSSESEAEKVTDRDSDQEIRDRIDRLKEEFSRVEEKIEKEALEQEEREKRQLKGETVSNDGSQSDVEDQVQQSSEGTSSRQVKQHSDSKYKETQGSRKDKAHELDKSNGKNKKYRDSSSSSSSSTDSQSSYDSKKRKEKYSRDRRHSRSRSRLSDRRRKDSKSHYKRSRRSPDRRRQRSSSSSSSGRHSRKSSHRRDSFSPF